MKEAITNTNTNSKRISFLNPLGIVKNLWTYRELINQFARREVIGRYKGSYLGILWSFLTPLIMLFIYTFVFSVVFNARWGVESNNKIEFALILFCGLICYNIFAEVVGRAPSLIISHVNYVKKVIFPLEILPVCILLSSFVHFGISLIILVVALVVFMGVFQWTMIFIPLVLLPIILLTLGLGWLLAALGVFLRDIGHVVSILVTALMFLSPIFYPISAIPEEIQFIYHFNPISYVVEDIRRVTIWGELPNWEWLFIGSLIGFIITMIGYAIFQKARKGFADVL